MAPLLALPVEIVSLQAEARAHDIEFLQTHRDAIRHFGPAIADFLDTAALIALTDVVVCVDTSVAHLAAALARPTFILLPHVPDWRWRLNRRDSPWYPTARLVRQSRPGDWDDVISRVAAEIRGVIASNGRPRWQLCANGPGMAAMRKIGD
jgi:ADP-heptose:LPS heptosyltransferase